MYLERPIFEANNNQPTWNEWRDAQAQVALNIFSEDSLALSGSQVTTREMWECQMGRLQHWVRTKDRHHLYVEVRERYTNKALYGPLKIYVHDLASYMFDTDTVWAFIEQRRDKAVKMFEAEDAAYIKRLDAWYTLGKAKQVFDPVLGEIAVFDDGTAEYFIGSDELTDAYEAADNFYVAFSVNPFETKAAQSRKQRETNRNALMSMLAGGQNNNE